MTLQKLVEEADRYFSSTCSRISAIAERSRHHQSPLIGGQQAPETSLEADAMAPPGPSAPIGSTPIHNLETSQEVFAISNRGGYHPRGTRSGTGPRGRGGRKGPQLTPKYTLCQYHASYGNNARKCIQPCLFNQPGNAPSGRGPSQ